MTFIFYIVASACLAIGIYLSVSTLLCFPSGKTVKAIRGVKEKRDKTDSLVETMKPLIKLLNRFLPMSDYNKKNFAVSFERLGIAQSPETYINAARARSVLFAGSGVAFILFGIPLLAAIVFIGAVLVYLKFMQDIKNRIKKLNAEIESELPRLIEMLTYSLSENRDVIAFFIKYRQVAGEALGAELDRLILDMQTMNMQLAYKRFDARLSIPDVSSLVAILSGVQQGGDQRTSLMILEQDVRTKEREKTKKTLDKNPRRVKTACFILTTLMVFMFMVPIVLMILNTLNTAGI